jgi:signal transduction histidine kinase
MPLRIAEHVRRSRWTLPLALAGALVVLVINETAYRSAGNALAALDERVEVRRDVLQLGRRIAEAEGGQRGYLLTGHEEYLEPYAASTAGARALVQRLHEQYAGDALAAALMAEIADAAEFKLTEMETAVALYREQRHDAWQALLTTNIGKEKMDVLRSATERLIAMENARVVDGRDRVAGTLRISRHGLNAMAALSVLALFLFLRQSLAFDTAQRRHAQELQAERDHLEQQVERRTAELSELAQHLQTAREDERARLARELHDELGALLTAAKLDAARLKRSLGGPREESDARLTHLNETINRGIELKRRIIEDLRPSALNNLGLRAALDILTREFARRSELTLQADLQDLALDEGLAITVYRTVQESLTNVAKHARAHNVGVTLRSAPSEHDPAVPGVAVEIVDDGVGFEPAAKRGSRHGLLGMRHRVQALGGRLGVESTPGRGTRLSIWLPVHAPSALSSPASPASPAPEVPPAAPAPPAPAAPSPAGNNEAQPGLDGPRAGVEH